MTPRFLLGAVIWIGMPFIEVRMQEHIREKRFLMQGIRS